MTRSETRFHARAASVLAAGLVLGAALLAGSAAAGEGGGGGGGGGPDGTSQIGKTKKTPKPSCPKDPCQAIGSVTGFQLNAEKEKNMFAAPQDGQLVAWSVDLSRPKPSQQKFFGKFYKDKGLGTVPAARIAVLKPADKATTYRLQTQSPVVNLSEDLGSKPIYTLQEPIPISKGEIVALTIPTWIPNFAVDLSRRNVWRASRDRGLCENPDDIKQGEPHQNVGSEEDYACTYRQARILYWAFFVPS